MNYLLCILGVLFWLAAGQLFATATTSIGQILAAILLVSGSVLLAGGCIIGAIYGLKPKAPGDEKPPIEM